MREALSRSQAAASVKTAVGSSNHVKRTIRSKRRLRLIDNSNGIISFCRAERSIETE